MYTPKFTYIVRSEIPSPTGEQRWMAGYNAAIHHFEDQLGDMCRFAFGINDGSIGLERDVKLDGDYLAHTSFHNHSHGQTFLVLRGSGELVVSHLQGQEYHKRVFFEAGHIFHLPGSIYHQLRLPGSATEPIQYLCIRPAEGRFKEELCKSEVVGDVAAHLIADYPENDLTDILRAANMYRVTTVLMKNVDLYSSSDRLLVISDASEDSLRVTRVSFVAAGEKLIADKQVSSSRGILFEVR